MRAARPVLACLSALGLTLAACTSESSRPTEPRQPELAAAKQGQRYIVVLRPTTSDPGVKIKDLEKTHGAKGRHVYRSVYKGFSAELPLRALEQLRRDPSVAYIEAVQPVYPGNHTNQTAASANLDRIDQINRPLSGTYGYISRGTGVTVYIIDTGIRTTHTQFGGRASMASTFVSEDGQGLRDCSGHGTAVAGLVGATTYGVAKDVRLVGLKVFPCPLQNQASNDDVVAALNQVRAIAVKPAIVNMSLGGSTSNALDDAVRSVVAAGIPVVVSAGNSTVDACQQSPARTAQAITVGNIFPTTDVKVSSSNFGPCVDLFAPGSGSTSVSNANDVDSRGFSGTSAASPHVAGVAALYMQNNRTALPDIVAQSVINSTSKNVLSGLGTGSPNLLLNSVGGSMVVTVSGPSSVSTATPQTWTASVAGGLGHFVYRWEKVTVSTGARFPFGTTTSPSLTVTPAANWNLFQIVANVSSLGSPEARGVKTVANRIPGSCTFC